MTLPNIEKEVKSMSDADIKKHFQAERQTVVEPMNINQKVVAILRKHEITPDFTTLEFDADIYDTTFLRDIMIESREDYGIEDKLDEEDIKYLLMLEKYADMVIIPAK